MGRVPRPVLEYNYCNNSFPEAGEFGLKKTIWSDLWSYGLWQLFFFFLRKKRKANRK